MVNKICKQCGVVKPISEYRKNYGKRSGYYPRCKLCDSINARAKYLQRKTSLTELESKELSSITQYWTYLDVAGNTTPLSKSLVKTSEKVAHLLSQFEQSAEYAAPEELTKWLSEPLTDTPEHYLDVVYEELRRTYKPVLRVSVDTLDPVYDETHTSTLEQILVRFYNYEDEYYESNS